MKFQQHILAYILIPLATGVLIVSAYRFFVAHDYIVEYQIDCDPESSKCFVGCDDDDCTQVYYYANVQKYAPDIFSECGEDVSECEQANSCLPSDTHCTIIYCDPQTVLEDEECSTITEEIFSDEEDVVENNNLVPVSLDASSSEL